MESEKREQAQPLWDAADQYNRSLTEFRVSHGIPLSRSRARWYWIGGVLLTLGVSSWFVLTQREFITKTLRKSRWAA